MDLPQALLFLAIFLISAILVIVGVQLIILLRDARETLRRADNLLADLEFLSHSFTRGSSSFSHLATGLQSGLQLISLVSSLLSTKSKQKTS